MDEGPEPPTPPALRGFPPRRSLAHTVLGRGWVEQVVEDLYVVLRGTDPSAQLTGVNWLGDPQVASRVDPDGRLTAQQVQLRLQLYVVGSGGRRFRIVAMMTYQGSELTTDQADLSYRIDVERDEEEAGEAVAP